MLIHLDGFDSYTNLADFSTEYSNAGGYFSISYGRFGGGCWYAQGSGNGGYFSRSISNTTQIWTGFSVYFPNGQIQGNQVTFYSPSGQEFGLGISGQSIYFYKTGVGLQTTILPANTIRANMWNFIEFYYSYGTTTGNSQVWLNGVEIASFTGNTANVGGNYINAIIYGFEQPSSIAAFFGYIDDLYIIDATQGSNTTRLGDCRIGTIVPASNASPNNGTPSSGAAYSCVNEAQYNTTNYVTLTNATGQEELYNMTALPSTPTTVFGMRVLAVTDKSDAGAAFIYPICVSSSVEADGSSQAVSTSWARQYSIIENDPHISAAWTASSIAVVQCGAKVA